MSRVLTMACIALFSTAIAPTAMAQVEQVSFNFGEIRMQHTPATGSTQLDLDLTVAADGGVSAAIGGLPKAGDVTLKRGVMGSASMATWLFFRAYADDGRGLGEVLIELPESGAARDLQIDLPSRADGDARIRVEVADAHPGQHLRFRFDPKPGQQLIGSPTTLFMPAGADAPLYATVPVPRFGQASVVWLHVVDAAQPMHLLEIKMRVTIRHGD